MGNQDSKSSRLSKQWRRYEQSETTVAAIFGGIAALFIAGIAAAFLYAKDTNPTQSASTTLPSPSSVRSTAQVPPTSPAPETTGSGSANTPQPKQQAGKTEPQKQR